MCVGTNKTGGFKRINTNFGINWVCVTIFSHIKTDEARDVTVFEYVTETLARDAHNKEISAQWALKLGLCDVAGVDLKFVKTEYVHIAPDRTFRSTMGF